MSASITSLFTFRIAQQFNFGSLTMIKATKLSKTEFRIEKISLCLIVVSLINLSIGTLPDLPDRNKRILDILESIITIFFTIEYIARIIYARKNNRKYIFTFFGIVDMLAILPFFLTLGTGFQSVRVVRLIRVFRILKFARQQQNAFNRLSKAFKKAKSELIVFVFGTIIMLYLSATGIYVFEHEAQPEVFKSIFHSLWWAVATLTTVGYGDIYPITFFGRAFTFIVLMIGVGTISVPSALMVSALGEVIKEEKEKSKKSHAAHTQNRFINS